MEYTYKHAYTDLVIAYVRRHQSLDIICFTHVFHRKPLSGDTGIAIDETQVLPSWVPDWSTETWSYVVPVMASQTSNTYIGNFRPGVHNKDRDSKATVPYTASGTFSSECIFSIDRTILISKGVVVDTISGRQGYEGHKHENPTINPWIASQILEVMSRSLLLGRKDRYLVHVLAPREVYHDFRSFCLAAMDKSTPVWDVFQTWFNDHEDFRVHGKSLKMLIQASMVDTAFAPPYNKGKVDLTRKNRWLTRFGDIYEQLGMARTLVSLQSGGFGMGSTRVRPGDNICVLLGCSIPVVLRPMVGGEGNVSKWEMIGEFYLDHIMKGGALEVDYNKFTIFNIA